MSRPVSSFPAFPLLAMLSSIVSLCVGTSFAKTLFPVIGAEGTTTYRAMVSAILLLAIWRPWRKLPGKRDAGVILIYGIALGSLNLLFYLSLETIPFGVAVALEFTGPLAVAIFSSRRLIDFIWIALVIGGLLFLLPIWEGSASLDPLGVAYSLAAAACWALYIIFGQKAGGIAGGQATAWGMTTAALLVAPFGFAEAGTDLFDPGLILAGIAVGILSSAIPFSLEMVALKRLPARTFSIMLSMEPAIAALAGLMFLGETLSWPQWLAIASVVTASIGSAATSRKAVPLPASE